MRRFQEYASNTRYERFPEDKESRSRQAVPRAPVYSDGPERSSYRHRRSRSEDLYRPLGSSTARQPTEESDARRASAASTLRQRSYSGYVTPPSRRDEKRKSYLKPTFSDEESLHGHRNQCGGNILSVRKDLEDMFHNHVRVEFEMSWPLRDFMTIQYPRGIDIDLEDVICLVGDIEATQATTIEAYVEYHWDDNGRQVLYALTQALRNGSHQYEARLRHGELIIQIFASSVGVTASGRRSFLVEVGEVLTFISSACRVSPPGTGIARSVPLLAWDHGLGICKLRQPMLHHYSDAKTSSRDTSCWQQLFRDAVVASGYPVNNRERQHVGLEIPWSMMVALAEIRFAVQEGRVFLLTGSNVILVPVDEDASTCVWHLLADPNRQLTYTEAASHAMLGSYASVDQWLYGLSGKRHFVGWTAKAEVLFGTRSAEYKIQRSGTEKSGAGMWRIGAVTFGGGQYVNVGASFVRGQKDTPAYLNNVKSYDDKVIEASLKTMIIHDVETRQSWLTDAASGLLHLCRAWLSLRLNPSPETSTRFREARQSFAHAEKFGTDHLAAQMALLDPVNRGLPLSVKEMSKTERRRNEETGCIETINTAFLEMQTWGQYVEARWDDIQVIYADQRRLQTSPTLTNGWPFGDSVQAYEFSDVAAGTSPLYRHSASLGKGASEWRKLPKHSDCIVLLGYGFGKLITLSSHGESGRPRRTAARAPPNIPGSLIAPMHVLKMLSDGAERVNDGTVKLADGLYWINPETVFRRCKRCGGYCAPELARLSTRRGGRSHVMGNVFDLYRSGAVVFGNESSACRRGRSASNRRRDSSLEHDRALHQRNRRYSSSSSDNLRTPSPRGGHRRPASLGPDYFRPSSGLNMGPDTSGHDKRPGSQYARSRAASDSGVDMRGSDNLAAPASNPTSPGNGRMSFEIRIPSIVINDLTYTTAGTSNAERTNRRPAYTKINQAYLDVRTLHHFQIPYFFDPADPKFLYIEQHLTHEETERLFEHTRLKRAAEGLRR